MNTPVTEEQKPHAGTLRQLIASAYDSLLLLAILLIASALTLPLTQAGIIKPNNPILSLYLLAVCFLFHAGFWTHGGQTLGMKVWHIRIEQMDGKAITWKQAFIRFVSGLPAWGMLIFGLIRYAVPEHIQLKYFADWLMIFHPAIPLAIAAIWLVIDHREGSWRDKLSATHMVGTNKRARTI